MSRKNKLQKITDEWMQLERKTLEQRRIAEEFYDTNLMVLIEDDYIKRNAGSVFEKVQYLVVSVGTSYEPIVLNIKLLKPKKVLFLYTDASEKTLDKVVDYCNLVPRMFDKSMISETNPLEIYREIKKAYLAWNCPEKMYIDFTGGTKAMSAAAAMAGAMINVQLLYVGTNDYLSDFRKPTPGSETLFFISNPLTVFGDLEIEKSLELFSRYNYAGAKEKLKILKENIPDPNLRQELNFVYLLAESYEAWDALDFELAYEYLSRLNRQIMRDKEVHPTFLLMDFFVDLKRQEEILSYLKEIPAYIKKRQNPHILLDKNMISSLMFTMFQNAKVREKQEKYDMATLLLYRLLEMIVQRRLSCYGLYVSKMNYMNIQYRDDRTPEMEGKEPEEQFMMLKSKVSAIKEQVFGRRTGDYLPDQVSLLEGFIILLALGDEIVTEGKVTNINLLKKIRFMVFLRNNSIFAHGLGPVGYGDFSKFKAFVLEMFKAFCHIEKIDYREGIRSISWLDPMDSVFYTSSTGGR